MTESSLLSDLIPKEEDSTNTKILQKTNTKIKFMKKYKFPLISTLLTILLIFIPIFVLGKQIYYKHINVPTLNIVDNNVRFVFWILHCISIIALPWLFAPLFNEKIYIVSYFVPPLMMFLDDLGLCMPTKCYCIPFIIELLISLFMLIQLPFKSVYIWEKSDFWLGEITQMLTIKGGYLAIYSIFTLITVGLGFLMSFKNSLFMTIPFLFLSISTIINNKIIGTLLFSQIFVHLIYLILIQFEKSRKLMVDYGDCCYCCDCFVGCFDADDSDIFLKTGNKSIASLLVGDLIQFFMIVFPIFGITLNGIQTKIKWGFTAGGIIAITVGVIFQLIAVCAKEYILWPIFVNPFVLSGAVYFFGFGLKGYLQFTRAYTFEITYLTWSIILDISAFKNGHAPLLYKIYRILIIIASLTVIELFEGVGWMEIVFATVQMVIDIIYMGVIISKAGFYGWAVFSASGIAFFSIIPCIVVLIIFLICECMC